MKVLQVLPTLSAGGAEGFVANLSVALKDAGAEVRVYLLGGVRGERGEVLRKRLGDSGIEVQGLKQRYPGSPENIWRLLLLIRSWRPDVVQVNLASVEAVCAIVHLLARGAKPCYVRRLANTDFVGTRSPAFVRWLDRFYPTVVACSDAVAHSYGRVMAGREPARVFTIPNGGCLLDTAPDPTQRCRARALLALPEDAFVVAHIGRMFSGKGNRTGGLETGQKAHDVLLRSFADFCRNRHDTFLLLVGDGPLRSEAESLARRLGIFDRTRFLGLQAEPWPALMAADVFFFPSRYEGLPNVLPEAASCGLPVVASDIPEIRNIKPEGAPWVLKPVDEVKAFAEGLREVAGNIQAYRARAEEAAPAVREQFSMETCARRYIGAYEDILRERNAKP